MYSSQFLAEPSSLDSLIARTSKKILRSSICCTTLGAKKKKYCTHQRGKCLTRQNCPTLPPPSKIKWSIPYVGSFSAEARRKLRKLVTYFCKDLDIELIFTSFKIRNMFIAKGPIPSDLRSRVVYKFTCAVCNACYNNNKCFICMTIKELQYCKSESVV